MSSRGAESDDSPGTLLDGKYQLVRLIGRGGFGSVYEAEYTQLGRRCAIKLLDRGLHSQRSRLRFTREARVLARLEHENIVSLLDAGEDPVRGQYLALEFIRGTTLREALTVKQPEPRQRVVDIAVQLARGLLHAHGMGIVHRDLKPENVMLTTHADNRLLVKILDFGVARLVEGDHELISTTGAALGTAAYMAPEQARGDKDIDHRADVFALGVIVYEAVSGVRPFDGDSYNETLFRILTKPHVPLSQLRPDLPTPFCNAVERALAKDRAERFSTTEEFALALSEAHGAAISTTLADETSAPGLEAPALPASRVPEGESRSQRHERQRSSGAMGRGALLGGALGILATVAYEGLRPAERTGGAGPDPSAAAPPAPPAASTTPPCPPASAATSATSSATPPVSSARGAALAPSVGANPVETNNRQPRAATLDAPSRPQPTEPPPLPRLPRDRGF